MDGLMMTRELLRHGCLALAAGAGLASAALAGDHLRIQTRVFEIEYDVNDAALPLDSVQLWYTLDQGTSWHLYGQDEDRQSPITFHAPSEGQYGFFFVLTNATGASSAPPTPSTKPHLRALVDFTTPVVQLHDLRQTTLLGQRVLQVRWTAIDTNLSARPVEIAYQQLPDETWYPATADPLANTGRYDWRLPDGLVGPVAVRLTVSDKAGHRVESERRVFESTTSRSIGAPPAQPAAPGALPRRPTAPGAASVSKEARARAARLYAEALTHRERGEYRDGIARLREAVRLNPQLTDAFAEMGGMLYLLGDLDRALNAYGIALKQQPTLRGALQGRAKVHRLRNEYSLAAESLRTILRYNPDDAEVWMNLGDIAVYQGDELLARECYTRATQIDPQAKDIIEQAQKRLALMAEVSRTYRETGQ